ncbi:hypothetical protein JVT61DRAFT_7626 [Boletus reticuloceps]|uniref:Uncharacterized protein n=1 Tax=Boletus reticuloceps TaxID=495285 RepID=A0A8I2YI64_9AGAM|nr:hypothetical protein JVT61DRAFT_7626 [Boletus reticuloceps]
MHKRKHRKLNIRDDGWEQPAHPAATSHVQSTEAFDTSAPDSCLYIQAHEADVIRGPPAMSARLLECQDSSIMMTPSNNSRSGLIRWGPPEGSGGADTVDTEQLNQPALWVDRFDVRLLLDHSPGFPSENIQVRPISPSGWSDLPSDSEDTFFFSPDELEDYRRDKRRKLLDRGREERLRALETIDDQERDTDPWEGSDEEPDEAQRELIRRTASHIISSPNPAQLEMRILANYGTDKRFAFLRGRWSRVWRTEKERVRQRQAEEAKEIQPPTTLTSLGGLASYGGSDTDGEESADEPTEGPRDVMDAAYAQDGHDSEDAVKEARRARAKEWSARRRAKRSGSQSEQV